MSNELTLRPSYWASVSGGKDSLYMLKYILSNLDKYSLNGVVHFELEIDYPFIKDVINYMESECKKFNIPFVRIKPRKSWEELYKKNGFPTRKARWCNSKYKLDARKQLNEFLKQQGFYCVFYIGYCYDEPERYNKRIDKNEIYPLVDAKIYEADILKWAQNVSVFNNYYLTNKRCGCMYCPLAARINFAYLYKYYPEQFNYMIDKMRETEKNFELKHGRKFSVISSNPKYNADYLEDNIKNKWLKILNEKELKK